MSNLERVLAGLVAVRGGVAVGVAYDLSTVTNPKKYESAW